MDIRIPYALTYTVTLTASTTKKVVCEKCGHLYCYEAKRKASGEGMSLLFLDNRGARTRAESYAADDLQMRLQKAIEAVPCPECGWYQEHMVAKARGRDRGLMKELGLVATVVSLVGGAITALLYAVQASLAAKVILLGFTVVVGVAGLLMFFLGRSAVERYDPNAVDRNERIALGKRLSLPAEAVHRLLKAERMIEEVSVGSVYPLRAQGGDICLVKVMRKREHFVDLICHPTGQQDVPVNAAFVKWDPFFFTSMNVVDLAEEGAKPLAVQRVPEYEMRHLERWSAEQETI